jgi:hypothetical protein
MPCSARSKPADRLHPANFMIGHDRIVDLRMQVVKLGLVGFI